MYPITFLTSYLLLVFCHFGATEPPPSHGYGPPSPVEFGSNEIGSHEQYSAPADFGSYNSFGSGSPSSYSAPSSAYKSGPPSFPSHYSSGGGGGGGPKYSSGLGGKGGVSSSYISIVHGAGSANGPGKLRPSAYSAPGKGPASVINSYNPPSFGNAASTFTDVKSYGGASPYSGGASAYSGGASPYSSGEAFGSSGYTKFGGGNPAAYSAGSYESFSPGSSADYNKGYESGGVSDEVASYSSGGPSYATFTGSSKLSYTPSFSQGSRGNAFSTSNVNVFGGGKSGGHGSFHAPSYTAGSVKPSNGAKVYSRYSGPSSFGPSSSSYSSPSLSSGESGYNSRALKAGYGIENSEDFASSEDSNVFNGAFGDGAGFKVQSSYSTG
ncbi:prisilkin-39-like [Planococcus citri]|uniref:prisilkin-39-like n=1 Tax=Planococcus citri TaxID=170843 RepID=UPI0031F962B1